MQVGGALAVAKALGAALEARRRRLRPPAQYAPRKHPDLCSAANVCMMENNLTEIKRFVRKWRTWRGVKRSLQVALDQLAADCSSFLLSITLDIMRHPLRMQQGQTYETEVIRTLQANSSGTMRCGQPGGPWWRLGGPWRSALCISQCEKCSVCAVSKGPAAKRGARES